MVHSCVTSLVGGREPTCDSVNSWWLYSSSSLGHQPHWHHDLLSHSVALFWHWSHQSLPYPNNAEHQARESQVSLVWLDQCLKPWGPDLNLWPSDSPISQNGWHTLFSFGHPDWLVKLICGVSSCCVWSSLTGVCRLQLYRSEVSHNAARGNNKAYRKLEVTLNRKHCFLCFVVLQSGGPSHYWHHDLISQLSHSIVIVS